MVPGSADIGHNSLKTGTVIGFQLCWPLSQGESRRTKKSGVVTNFQKHACTKLQKWCFTTQQKGASQVLCKSVLQD